MIVVADSGPLHYLILLEQTELLHRFYGDKGVKKAIWFHEDEAEALRLRVFKDRRSESAIVREAVWKLLGIED